MTQEEYKRNISDQRKHIHHLKQLLEDYVLWQKRVEDRYEKLKQHADSCCTCGNKRH